MAVRPIATVGDLIAYMLDRGMNSVMVSPMLHSYCGVSRAVREATRMKLITSRHTHDGDILLTWNV